MGPQAMTATMENEIAPLRADLTTQELFAEAARQTEL